MPTPALELSLAVIVPATLVLAVMFGFLARLVVRAHLKKPTTGEEGMVGKLGTAKSEIDGTGKVFVHGEYWDVRSKHKIAEGQAIRVTGVQDLILEVEPVSEGTIERE